MAYVVTVTNHGADFWLRGTVWTSDRDRAAQYPSVDAAQAALTKARPFMHARIAKAARIVPDA